MKKLLNFLAPGFFPFSLCILLGVFIILYRLFDFPQPEELAQYIVKSYEQYGLVIVFVSAIIESLFMLGIYLPGSLAIVLAVFSLGNNNYNLFYIGSLAVFGFTVSNIINYFLGKYGYYRLLLFFNQQEIIDKMQKRLEKNSWRTIFLTSFHPNFLAITMVCLGIGKINLFKSIFSSTVSLIFWVTLWTFIASKAVKTINLQDSNQSLYLLGLFFIWGIFLIVRENIKSQELSSAT